MRRILSILMMLVLGLGPALTAVPAEALAFRSGWSGWSGKVNETRLPACCRRHGAHHCSMGAEDSSKSAAESDTLRGAIISAFSTCPFSPRSLASIATASAALAAGTPRSPAFLDERRALPRSIAVAAVLNRHGWPKRGPPNPPMVTDSL